MGRAVASWSLPTTRDGGAAFDPATELANSEIRMSADDGVNWTDPALLAPADTQFVVENLAPGTYLFQLVFIDIDGRRSDAAEATGALVGAPSAATDFSVTIEE